MERSIPPRQGPPRVTVRIPAVRGEILDRNGIPLVQNRASFDVDFYLPDMVSAYRRTHNNQIPKVRYRGTVRNMPKDMEEADVARIVSEQIIPRLEELGVAQDYNAKRLQIHFRNKSEIPFNYMQDLDFEKMAVLSENNLGLPGVTVTKKPVRQYVYGSLAAICLGTSALRPISRSCPTSTNTSFTSRTLRARPRSSST